MASALGFEQSTETVYIRKRNDWYDFILLETSRWGGNGFDIWYGIWLKPSDRVFYSGLSDKLKRRPGKPHSWNRYTKADIEKSAVEAHEMFLNNAEPFLKTFQSKLDVGKAHLTAEASKLESQLTGKSYRNESYIKRMHIFLEWAGLYKEAAQVLNGTFRAEKKKFWSNWRKT